MEIASTTWLLQLVAVSILSVLPLVLSEDWGQWHQGRATFHGTDAWPIHKGSCGYGYLDPEIMSGWDITALADMNWDYMGSCGRCYEVKCRQTWFNDGFGEKLDRTSVCRDASASVVVQVTDTCACYYKGNPWSNKRWCCGDMQHFDLSTWAYEKLADKKWGVIGIEFRRVPCSYKPPKPAYAPDPTPMGPFMGWKPWDWHKGKDRRGNQQGYQWQNTMRSSASNWAISGRKLQDQVEAK